MGYLVATTGRLLLPQDKERQALTVAEHRIAGRDGWFDPDTDHVDSLADLAAVAGVTLTREGDWLSVATDHQGDPKWSDQAEEFYRSLADFVQQGEVHLRGEDGSTWSYAYSPAGLLEHGREAPPLTEPAEPTEPDEIADTGPVEPPPAAPEPPAAPTEEPGTISYPGKEQRPPGRPSPPTPPAGRQDAGWAGVDDDPPPAPASRVVLMSVVLVVGVALIIGLALVVAGI